MLHLLTVFTFPFFVFLWSYFSVSSSTSPRSPLFLHTFPIIIMTSKFPSSSVCSLWIPSYAIFFAPSVSLSSKFFWLFPDSFAMQDLTVSWYFRILDMWVAFLSPTQRANNVLGTRYYPQKVAVCLSITPSPISKSAYSVWTACCNHKCETKVNVVFYIHCSSLMINVNNIFMIDNKRFFLSTPWRHIGGVEL
jgi:hypothetical protein